MKSTQAGGKTKNLFPLKKIPCNILPCIASFLSIILFSPPSYAARPDTPHATDYLTAGCHTLLFPALSENARTACLNQIRSRGYTHFYVYVYNEQDFGGPSFDFYQDPQTFISRLREIRRAGLKPVVFLNPDDAPINKRRSIEDLKDRLTALVPRINSLVSSYVLSLEIEQSFSKSKANQLGQHLRTLTSKSIANHQLPGRWDYCESSWCDYAILQYGFKKTAQYIEDRTHRAINDLRKPVVAGEYSRTQESESIRLGDIAVEAGAAGFANGGTP